MRIAFDRTLIWDQLHKGDRDAAIRSLQESVHLSKRHHGTPEQNEPNFTVASPLGGASPSPRPLSPAGQKSKINELTAPAIVSPVPHSYYQIPKPEKLLSSPLNTSPAPKQSQIRDKLPPPPDSVVELSVPLRPKDDVISMGTTSGMGGLSPSKIPAIQAPDSGLGSTANGFPMQVESWDFKLPIIDIPVGEPPFSPDEGRRLPFSMIRLIATLQRGLSPAQLQHYILFFDEKVVQSGMNASISGIPTIFFAVATNDENIVRTWAAHGADVNVRETRTGIPLLAFAIMRTRAANEDTTSMLMTLLSLGADPTAIPRSLFSPCLDDPTGAAPRFGLEDSKVSWCSEKIYAVIAKTINLSQRYFMDKVLKSQAPTSRQSQVTRIHNATALLGVSHFLIGQTAATQLVADVLISHLALPRTKPLVMAFTGTSKTVFSMLVRQFVNLMGNILQDRQDMEKQSWRKEWENCSISKFAVLIAPK